jgi:hypothetical protein
MSIYKLDTAVSFNLKATTVNFSLLATTLKYNIPISVSKYNLQVHIGIYIAKHNLQVTIIIYKFIMPSTIWKLQVQFTSFASLNHKVEKAWS